MNVINEGTESITIVKGAVGWDDGNSGGIADSKVKKGKVTIAPGETKTVEYALDDFGSVFNKGKFSGYVNGIMLGIKYAGHTFRVEFDEKGNMYENWRMGWY